MVAVAEYNERGRDRWYSEAEETLL